MLAIFRLYILLLLFVLPSTARASHLPIEAGGNIGIGSTVPQQKLDVEGTVYFGTGNVGIGSTAPQQKLEVKGGAILGTEVSNTPTSTITVDWASGNQQYVALNQIGHTLNFTSGSYKVGQLLRLIICQDLTGNRTITTWDSSIVWSGGSAPTLTSGASKCDVVSFVCTNAKGSVKNFGAVTSNF